MDNSSKKLSKFISRNIVAIVMVPAIIVFHLGWNSLQDNRSLVQEHEKIDMPPITFYKYCLNRLGIENAPGKTTAAVKADSS